MARPRVRAMTLAQLEGDAAALVHRMAATGEVVAVTRDGEAVAVMMTPQAYDQLWRDRERLRLLALGELEAAAGEGHSLTEVVDDARALLNEN